MPGFLRAATIVLTGSAVVAGAVLAVLPSLPDGVLPIQGSRAGVRIAELPRVPCKDQLWPNTDRVCQSWTAPKPQVASMLAAASQTTEVTTNPEPPQIVLQRDEPKDQETVGASAPAIADARTIAGETPKAVQARTHQAAQRQKVKLVPTAHNQDEPDAIAVTARSASGERRVIMIRPTTPQDQFYYSAHRDLAAATVAGQ
jgi:hypothetical protein